MPELPRKVRIIPLKLFVDMLEMDGNIKHELQSFGILCRSYWCVSFFLIFGANNYIRESNGGAEPNNFWARANECKNKIILNGFSLSGGTSVNVATD